ncbi:MAG: hypothetical protein ACOVP5_03215, partial [Chitinophagales bacterium]
IVFTHDITFLLMLEEFSKELKTKLEINSLTRKKVVTGIIANRPPWDTLSVGKRIKELNRFHQDLAKLEREETEEVYSPKTKTLYGMLRETWERCIEEIVLNDCIKRFGREIQTKKLGKIIDLTKDDYDIVEQNMSKCSKIFYGHDSAGELIDEVPSALELKSDIEVLDRFVIQIIERRK